MRFGGSWIRQLLASTHAPVQWDRVAATAVGVSFPIGLTLVLGGGDATVVGAGALASMGALVSSAADRGETGFVRIKRMSTCLAAGVVGFVLGSLVFGNIVATVLAVTATALASGLAWTVSAQASRAVLYLMLYTATAANADFGMGPWWIAPSVLALGGLWRIALTLIPWLAFGRRGRTPERRAVAAVIDALADQLDADDLAAVEACSDRVSAALDAAYDVMATVPGATTTRDPHWRVAAEVLTATAPVVDAVTTATANSPARAPDAVATLRTAASWVLDHTQPLPARVKSDDDSPDQVVLRDAVDGLSSTISRIASSQDVQLSPGSSGLPEEPTLRRRLRSAGHTLANNKDVWLATARLMLCIGVAQILVDVWSLDRPYLVLVTIAQVMKPELGSVFARAVQAAVGAVIGILGVVSLVAVFPPTLQWIAIVILAALVPIVMRRNYWQYSVVSTALALVLIELHLGNKPSLVTNRLTDTLLGCAIVVFIGYLPWPSTWRKARGVADEIGDLIAEIRTYLVEALSAQGSEAWTQNDELARTKQRRALHRHISDVRTSIRSLLAEPPPISTTAAGWWGVVDVLERLSDSITAAALTAKATDRRADPAAVSAALDELADELHHPAPSEPILLPEQGPLEPVAIQVRLAVEAVRHQLDLVG